MSTRPVPFTLALFACAVGSAALAFAQTPSSPTGKGANAPTAPNAAVVMAPIEFYLAHGEAEACGPGCDEWIAAEGKIDAGAADRFRQLLKTLKDRRPLVYLHSPGGNLNGALELGRLLHERKFTVSVGHTVPLTCSSDKQADNSCDAQKRAGKPIEAEISQTIAQCNSACVYVLAAGAPHSVPPGVKLGIHDAGLDPSAKTPNGIQLAAGLQLAHTRVRSYLRAMGMDDALFTATLATPFESIRILERDDLVRFGLDTRESGETVWQFVDKPTWLITKRFFVRSDGDQPRYVDATVSVVCSLAYGMHLVFTRQPLGSDPSASSAGSSAVTVTVDGKPINLARMASSNLYTRSGWVKLNAFDTVGDGATIMVPGTELARKEQSYITLSMDGFAAAYAKLRSHCSTQPTTTSLQSSAARPSRQDQPVPDQRTESWLEQLSKSKGAAPSTYTPVAPAAAAGKAQALELTRVATAAQKLRLDFLSDVRPDCSFGNPLSVHVVEQPQHGTFSTERGQAFTEFTQDDQRAACNTRKSDGTLVFYQPSADYHGADSVTVTVTPPLGGVTTRHYSIDVK